MKRVIHHLEEWQIKALVDLNKVTGRPQAEFVREALDLYLPFVTPNTKARAVLKKAESVYEDAQSPPAALTRAMFGWSYDQEDNSKRGALRRLEEEVARQGRLLQRICDKLGIDTETIDHD